MMTSLNRAMQHPPAPAKAPRQRPALRRARLNAGWRCLSVLAAVLLAGCGAGSNLPRVLYLAMGVNSDQTIDADLLDDTQQRLGELEAGYRQIHPNTNFQISLYPEKQLTWAMQRRNRAGLGPDLLLINGDTALRLLGEGLITPFPQTGFNLNLFEPEVLDRLRSQAGELAGLPVLVQTQVACFNRRRLPAAPATLDELLSTSAKGYPMGLPMEFSNLFWSVGSLGALEALETALAGRQPTRGQQQAIERWLGWLQNASNQQRITFYATQPSTEAEFLAGRLDWIPCRSTAIPRLRKALGAGLGVAPLPSGEGGEPSPINHLRVLALGTNSSQGSRERALAFSYFSVNALSQRNLTLGSQVMLPANRFVQVPLSSSAVLRAMVTSAQQGNQTNSLVELMHSNDARLAEIQALLTTLVFGEVPAATAGRQLVTILRNRP
jgi:arabinogalactan oligomer/maltooligosaccharide transport system substrate-binding protein